MVVLDDSTSPTCRARPQRIGVVKFVPADEIDPMWLDKSYYLEPDKSAPPSRMSCCAMRWNRSGWRSSRCRSAPG